MPFKEIARFLSACLMLCVWVFWAGIAYVTWKFLTRKADNQYDIDSTAD